MITFNELIVHETLQDIPIAHQQNLEELLKAMNVLRVAYGKPMIVTSGYRSLQRHKDIYRAKGVTQDRDIPMHSAHLVGLACDISDPKQELQKWCLQNVELLDKLGLYCEDFAYTENWVHFQTRMPFSGKRFFKP